MGCRAAVVRPHRFCGSAWLSETPHYLGKTAVESKHVPHEWHTRAVHARALYFVYDTDYTSSPYRVLDPQRVRTCISPGGQLVEAGVYTLLGTDPDTNER